MFPPACFGKGHIPRQTETASSLEVKPLIKSQLSWFVLANGVYFNRTSTSKHYRSATFNVIFAELCSGFVLWLKSGRTPRISGPRGHPSCLL